MPRFITDRDFVIRSRLWAEKQTPRKVLIDTFSIERDDCLPKDDYVRGEIKKFSFYIEETEVKNELYAIQVVQTDMKGYLPVFLLNSLLPTALKEAKYNYEKYCAGKSKGKRKEFEKMINCRK